MKYPRWSVLLVAAGLWLILWLLLSTMKGTP
jgi:hypothetical protein